MAGMHVRPISESRDDISLEPVAQVGFLNKETGKYVYFKANEIPEKNSLIEMGLDISEFQILSPKAEACQYCFRHSKRKD